MIHKWQKICYEKHGTHFVQASDEWYLLAEEPFPPEENYDGYIQLENGVGMIPLLASEFDACLSWNRKREKRPVSVKTLRQNRRFSTVWQKEKQVAAEGTSVSPYCIHCYRKISGTVDAEAGSKVYLPASGYQSQCISDSK